LTLMESLPSDRAPQRRAAHNSIFFLFPAFLGLMSSHALKLHAVASISFPLLARPVLGHTVKELVSRGLKSRSGVLHRCSTTIDVPSLGRPLSWRPAKLSAPTPVRQPILTSFLNFFAGFPQVADSQRREPRNFDAPDEARGNPDNYGECRSSPILKTWRLTTAAWSHRAAEARFGCRSATVNALLQPNPSIPETVDPVDLPAVLFRRSSSGGGLSGKMPAFLDLKNIRRSQLFVTSPRFGGRL
jgi:hypothetical protein